MPELVKLYIRHALIGAGIAAMFTIALYALNVANLRHLVNAVDGGYVALVLLLAGNVIIFSGVQFAVAVMLMADKPQKPRGKKIRVTLIPILLTETNQKERRK